MKVKPEVYEHIKQVLSSTRRTLGKDTYWSMFAAGHYLNFERCNNHACFSSIHRLYDNQIFVYGSNWQGACKSSVRSAFAEVPLQLAVDFVKFITDPIESPWKDWLHILNTDPFTCEEHATLGMVVCDGNIPANVLTNFFKCHRMLGEYPSRVVLWGDLVNKMNVPPREALFLCTQFETHAGNRYSEYYCSHSFINGGQQQLLFDRLTSQKMNTKEYGALFDAILRPLNALNDKIWNLGEGVNFLSGLVSNLCKKDKEYIDPFTGKKDNSSIKYVTLEQIAEIGQIMRNTAVKECANVS